MLRQVFSFGLIAALGLLATGELIAQTPVISGVWATFSPTGLSPGTRATIKGSHFSRQAIVEVGNLPAVVLGHSYDDWDDIGAEYLVVVFPFGLTAGESSLVVRTAAGSSPPFRIVLDEYAPGLFGGFLRSGRAVNCAPPGETPLAGEIVTASAVGLGATTSGMNFSTLIKPSIMVGGQAAEVMDSTLSSEPGWYRVSFRVPPGDGYHDVVLEIAGRKSNALFLPVGKAVVSWGSPPGVSAVESVMTAAACGGALATTAVEGDPRNPVVSPGGTTLKIKDSVGTDRLALLLYVSPRQVNYVVPAGTSTGIATITVTSADGSVSTGKLEIRRVAPQVFTVAGLPAAVLVRVRGGVHTVEPIFETSANGIVPVPIDMGPDTDQLFLLLFGTGLRFGANVTVTIGGVYAPVEYFGSQHEYAGMDQVNLRLPRALAGRGHADVKLMVDGEVANVTHLVFRNRL